MPGEDQNKTIFDSVKDSLTNATTYISDTFQSAKETMMRPLSEKQEEKPFRIEEQPVVENGWDKSFEKDYFENPNDNEVNVSNNRADDKESENAQKYKDEYEDSQGKTFESGDYGQQLNFQRSEKQDKQNFLNYLKQQKGFKETSERKQEMKDDSKLLEDFKKINLTSKEERENAVQQDQHHYGPHFGVMDDDERINEMYRNKGDQQPVHRDNSEPTNEKTLYVRDIAKSQKPEIYSKEQKVPIDWEKDSELTIKEKMENRNSRGLNEESSTRHDGLERNT